MKPIALLVGVVVIGGIGVYLANQDNSVEVIKESHDPVVKIETVDTLEERIQSAQNAEKERIEAEAQEMAKKHVESENEAIRQRVTAEYIAELEESITLEEY